ncbi:hypothetical protein [Sulfurimonas sp.]|jgi:hypothetical protein|uniref:hypothetical protein n=1 Tax=Sulfurimonas sp. TaxID=2022749 RepID=UPI0025D658AA|nr:hypothetical protein [Sulfurimonas sp.]MCK9472496.1 hypothetical protein [Sulfurimonas sp.]MDD3505400.1 hypothetical protein [Sulfurimonas sp.]
MRYLSLVFIFLLFLQAEEEYQLGKGIQVGSLPFYVGGYFSLDYKHTDDIDRYRVDDVAIIGYGNYEKFSYMAEFEFKELYVKTEQNGLKTSTNNNNLYTERLYLDYNFNENYMFRVGKYNSPIGFWNLLPVNVLRETTSNPMSVNILFPKFTTGLNSSYISYGEGELKVDVMLQHNNDIDFEYNNYKINEHYGFGVSYEKNDYAVKLNGGYFHNLDKNAVEDNLYYLLLSARYESSKYQILSEIGSQKSKSRYTTEYAGYIQGLYRFSQQHIGVIRVESYDDNVKAIDDDMLIIGYTYRPLYPIAIKSEYQFHSQSDQNQFLFSFSVLF